MKRLTEFISLILLGNLFQQFLPLSETACSSVFLLFFFDRMKILFVSGIIMVNFIVSKNMLFIASGNSSMENYSEV